MYKVSKIDGWCLIFLAALTVGIIFTSINAEAGYGAIAYSKATGNYGYSHGYRSREEAIWEAERRCGTEDCRWVVWFKDSCGALAVADNGGTGYSHGYRSAEQARQRALAECSRRGPNCRILCWSCSGNERRGRRW